MWCTNYVLSSVRGFFLYRTSCRCCHNRHSGRRRNRWLKGYINAAKKETALANGNLAARAIEQDFLSL